MKITTVLIMVALLQVQASVVFSQKKLNVEVKNVPLKEVLRLIMAQSDYRLFYNDNTLPEKQECNHQRQECVPERSIGCSAGGHRFQI